MGEYQWGGSDNSDLGYLGNWFPIQGGPIQEPGPNDLAIIEFGPALTGTLNVAALDLVQQGPGEPALSITGSSTQVTATSAGIANAVSLEAGALLQVGTLTTAAGCAFVATGAGTDVDVTSTLSLAGSITLDAGASLQAAALSIAGTSTVMVGGTGTTLVATVSTGNTMTVGSTAGNALLLVTGGASVEVRSYDTEGDLNVGGTSGSYGTLTVNGQASLAATPDNFVIGAGQGSNGLLNVTGAGTSAIFECYGAAYVAPAPGASGTINVTAGGYLELDSQFGVVFIDSDTSAKVLVSGAGSEIDAGPSVNIGGQTVYDYAGKGQVTVQSGGQFYAFDHTEILSSGSLTVTGAGSVYHTSQMQVAAQAFLTVGSGGLVQAGLVALDGGIIKLTGGALNATASYTAQSGTLTGFGSLASPRIINGGLIDAKGGTLHLTGAVSGTGLMHIETGSTLKLDNSVSTSQTIAFESGGNTLSLADAHDAAGKILDFAAGDAIDLVNTAATSLAYVQGALTVLDGTTKVATLEIKGSYALANFKLAGDGHGGSVITFVAPNAIGAPSLPSTMDHFHV